jgi:poly-gamma-glutamate synthesis protein (capsule biosynthesis protein)
LPKPGAQQIRLNNMIYRVGERAGMTYLVSDVDRAAILKSIAEARAQADYVALSIHAHETLSGGYEDAAPADFLPAFFRDAVGAGADVIVRHGPHAIKGLQVIDGKPVFHGMGSMFFYMNRQVTMAGEGPKEGKLTLDLPDTWLETALAVATYDGRKLREVRFHPMILKETAGQTRGFPIPALGADAARILGQLRTESAALGTTIRIVDGLGIYTPG